MRDNTLMPSVQQDAPSSAVADLYRSLLASRQARLAVLQARGRLLGWGKILLAVLELALALRFLDLRHGGWLLAPPALVFLLLLIAHEQILRALAQLRASVLFFERGLARLEDRWRGSGDSGERFADPSHLYARDLDLFGPGSLFELLATLSTAPGAETLAAWLLAPAPVAEVRLRQAAVEELVGRIELRESLFVAGHETSAGAQAASLTAWAEQSAPFCTPAKSLLALLLALGWLASLAVAIAFNLYLPVFLLTVFNFGLSLRWSRPLDAAADSVEQSAQRLGQLARVLALFESESFSSEKLRALAAGLRTAGAPPSRAIRALDRIAYHLSARRNLFVRVFDGLLFYSLLLASLAERWRSRHGRSVRGWLASLGEMEALSALACFAAEHPAYAWPCFVEDAGPLFEAAELAHPLLPAARAVRNSVSLGPDCQLIVLSGTNMAGKSTFIRALGANAVLAQCGAPVCAASLRLSPLALGASICVLDSLEGGISRFYAEIQRLKRIVDLTAAPRPVLFLFDELLSGTNSLDRRRGAEQLVRALAARGAIGLVSTHDLALTAIPGSLGRPALNFHFEDRFEDGKLLFDYRLKPGAVETSNALKLMQSVGLPCA